MFEGKPVYSCSEAAAQSEEELAVYSKPKMILTGRAENGVR